LSTGAYSVEQLERLTLRSKYSMITNQFRFCLQNFSANITDRRIPKLYTSMHT